MMIRRKKTTIFTDAKDTTLVLELKKMIEGKKRTKNQF
jgi:elongin-B